MLGALLAGLEKVGKEGGTESVDIGVVVVNAGKLGRSGGTSVGGGTTADGFAPQATACVTGIAAYAASAAGHAKRSWHVHVVKVGAAQVAFEGLPGIFIIGGAAGSAVH